MSQKTIGVILIVVGVVLLVVSLAADQLGIGAGGGIGGKQLAGAAVGIIVAVAGGWLVWRKPSGAKK
jgi:hypothetical protein